MHSQRRRSSVMGFEQTIVFGEYREKLENFAVIQSQKSNQLREERQQRLKDNDSNSKTTLWQRLVSIVELGGDWILLAIVAIIVAILSFLMDIVLHFSYELRDWLLINITDVFIYKLLLWIAFTLTLLMSAAVITRRVAPQAAGSGVAEMKIILRGVVLKEYLSFKTLIAKVIGNAFVLGSGLPLGREGPFVHISAMITNHLIKIFGPMKSQLEYESRFLDLIAVACAVGVATTFAAPVGGVLYSIEIMSVFFSVRSYWMGFFASTIGALFWRLLTVWFQMEDNITHIIKTDFREQYPYETMELIAFALLGVISGLSAYAFVSIQRQIVLFSRKRTAFHIILQKYPLIYPALITTFIALISFPDAFGQFYGSWLSSERSMHELFDNQTWGQIDNRSDSNHIVDNWRTDKTSIYVNTFLFFVMNLLIIALVSTLPVPGGIIVPSFKIGAGLGRFYGEYMAYLFPKGINPLYDRTHLPIIAGAYSVAGAAAFAGANTGALSSAVIVFEVTGQLTHLLPVIVSTIAATVVAQRLGPSIYDSLINLKGLPYLPAILPSSPSSHRIFVEDFMLTDVLYVWKGCDYKYLKRVLDSSTQLNAFPYVKSPQTMILLGTVERLELQALLKTHLSNEQTSDDLKIEPLKTKVPTPTCSIYGQGSKYEMQTIPEILDEVSKKTTDRDVLKESNLRQMVDFTNCVIDPAPLQLVEGTTLMKAHNLFSMLGLQLAYVTALGRLKGVVAISEIRKAIEQMNSGEQPSKRSNSLTETQVLNE